ncbi:translation protein SH3-like domain-containing protein [Nemania sp. NC0429]|nr:translation protein SH3-like domain-containing protein [Nemania sp. NC0429]
MLAQSARRPLGAWKGVLRRARQQHLMPFSRTMATETTPTTSTTLEPPPIPAAKTTRAKARERATIPPPPPPPKPYMHSLKPRNPKVPVRSAFAVYPRVPSARSVTPAPLASYHAQQVRRLDPKGLRTALFSRSVRDSAKPGDVLQVTTRRGEPFAGVCLSIRRAGVDSAILLRNNLTKLGVEMWYKIYSPNVLGVEIIWRRPKRARRARLTYMRQAKHDMGNVDHLVAAWRRARNVFSSKGKGKGKGKPGKGPAGAAAAGAKGGRR